ncbi:MAG: hypothetical protein J6Y02_24270, partial [Pseudobutyrivibrio sp.]|nr:hypothetical protein [Pseudobutyrivibrio sp.]
STAYATAAQGTTADSAVQSVKISGDATEYKAGTSVTLPAYPTSLPASDVSDWAKAANKPTYTASEVGAASNSHTHTASIASTTDTNELNLAANTKYKLTAGGSTFVFTTPTDTTYQSKAAASGGTDVSLVTTGEKYTWNNKSDLQLGNTGSTAAAGNHSHTTTLATDSGTPTVELVANTTYKLSAGGTTVIFKTAPDTTYQSKAAASGGADVSLVTTGEKFTWNNKSDLQIGTTGSTAAAGNHTHAATIATTTDTNQLTLAASTRYKLSAGGSTFVFTTAPNTTYESKAAASGGTDVSLVTTGDKYTWNNKSDLQLGNTAATAAAGNHTHTASIAGSTGTSQLDMAADTKYVMTAGGSSFIFKTPPASSYTSESEAQGGTTLSLVTTGEKYTWNHKSDLQIGTTSSTAAAGNHTHSYAASTSAGGAATNAKYATSSLTSTSTTQCLRNLASGTAAATTSNCPTGSWYGQHS